MQAVFFPQIASALRAMFKNIVGGMRNSKAPFTLYRFHTKTVQKCSVLAYRLHCTVFLSGIK